MTGGSLAVPGSTGDAAALVASFVA
jgi:hypothetical protein